MIVKMGHFTPEWAQNLAFVLGLHFKILNSCVVIGLYMVANKSDNNQYFEKTSYCHQNVESYQKMCTKTIQNVYKNYTKH